MTLPNFAYFRGQIVPYSDAKIGVMTHGLNYGTAAFGGVRGYWNDEEDELFIFRPRDHFARLLNSAKLLDMDIGLDPAQLTDITMELLRTENHRQDVYIRPLIYKSDEIIGVKLHDVGEEITIFTVPFDKYVSNDTNAHVTFSSWRRIDDNMIPARGKISGAYVNSALVKTDALRAGFDEALVLTQEGHVSEGSAENILEGITRKSILTVAEHDLGLNVIERPIDRTEVYLCDEFFMTGTAAQVTAVTRVDFRPIGSGEMGPTTARMRDTYIDIVRGQVPKYRHWNTPVFAATREAVGD